MSRKYKKRDAKEGTEAKERRTGEDFEGTDSPTEMPALRSAHEGLSCVNLKLCSHRGVARL